MHIQLYLHFRFPFMISMHQTQEQPVKMILVYMLAANDRRLMSKAIGQLMSI